MNPPLDPPKPPFFPTYARFCAARARLAFRKRYQNLLVHAFIATTPRSATPDTVSETIQELLAKAVRISEFRRYQLELRIEQLGKDLLS